MSKKSITTLSGITVIIAASAFLVINMMTSGRDGQAQAADAEHSKTKTGKAVSVQLTTPTQRPMTRILKMPATLLAGEMADLYAKTSGYISKINVDIGSRVTLGQSLLVIDVPEMMDEFRQAEAVLDAKKAMSAQARTLIDIARAEVQRYRAELNLKKITLQRKQELRKATAIPQQELDEAMSQMDIAEAIIRIAQAKVAGSQADVKVAESEVAMQEATIARLKTLMNYATIRAPFDGVISSRIVDPGAFVRSASEGTTTPLMSIGRVDFIRLVLEIPESDSPYVRVGTEVEIVVKALGDDPIKATITRSAMALKPGTRTMRTEIDLDNKAGRLAPGMYAQVVVKLETKQSAMMIPSKALRVRGRALSVMVAKENVAQRVPIVVGYDDGIWVEVLKGLTGDEQIIVSANSAIVPGTPVKAPPVTRSET